MKAKQLAQVIRKIVREEVQKEVRNVLTEQTVKQKSNIEEKETLTLTEALQDTKDDFPTMRTFNASDARAGFAAMQGGVGTQQAPNALEGHNGRVVPTDKVDPSVTKAITRDYSELVKRFKK